MRSSDAAPTRLVGRQVSELLLTRSDRWQAVFPIERVSGFIADVVIVGSMAHQPYRDRIGGAWIGIDQTRALGRAVSSAAIAQSMNLPHTTVRRRTAELVGLGLLERRPGGFVVGPARDLHSERALAVCEENAADLGRRLAVLADAGFVPAKRAMEASALELPAFFTERLLLTFGLRVLETFTGRYGDLISGTLVALITAINVRGVTADPVLAKRYADAATPPPDELREPVTLRELSRVCDIPFETVRRRTKALMARGVVEKKGDGVIVPQRVWINDANTESGRESLFYFEQLINTLIGLAASR